MWPVAGAGGWGGLVVEEEPADVAQGVGAAGGSGAGWVPLDVVGPGLAQRGQQQFAGLRVEVAPEGGLAVEEGGGVQGLGPLGCGGRVIGGRAPAAHGGGGDVGGAQRQEVGQHDG